MNDNLENHMVLNSKDAPWNQPDATEAEAAALNEQEELATLQGLSDSIDELSSTARDCATVGPDVARALDVAWYFAEDALRDDGREGSCGHRLAIRDLQRTDVKRSYCACCAHYLELHARGERVRGAL